MGVLEVAALNPTGNKKETAITVRQTYISEDYHTSSYRSSGNLVGEAIISGVTVR